MITSGNIVFPNNPKFVCSQNRISMKCTTSWDDFTNLKVRCTGERYGSVPPTVVLEGDRQAAVNQIAVTLSCDHRVVDGCRSGFEET